MGYNIDFTRFKSSGLAGLDCGSYLKVPRRDAKITVMERYTGDLEVGQCVSMIRVPKGARIVGMELTWGNTTTNAVLAVGDPFACGRFLGPIATPRDSGQINTPTTALDCIGHFAYGTCGKLNKTGNIGDGCGLFYQYTCETDIVITNLYAASQANAGGWAGGGIVAGSGQVGAKWTGGVLTLTVEYLQQS